MSRRLRVEKIKEKQLNVDLQEEEDKLKLLQERIYGPIVWRRLQSGYRIQDLKPKYYEEVLDMIMEHFVQEDVIFRNSKFLEDKESQKSYRERLLFNLKDKCSIILIEERRICKEERLESLECSCDSMNTEMSKSGVLRWPTFLAHFYTDISVRFPPFIFTQVKEDILAGVLLLKTLKKSDMGRVFSRVQITEGKSLKSIINFINHLNRKVDIYDLFDCDIYLRYYLICLKPEYRRKGLGYQLMNVGLDIARHLSIPVIMGVFDCFKLQKLAKHLGMQTIFEIEYVNWTDKSGDLVFCEPGVGNYTCAIMAGKVPPPPKTDSAIALDDEVNMKMIRSDKKKNLEKRKSKTKLK